MMLFMRTTLNINDALLEELKERARRDKRPMTKVVEEALQRGLSCTARQASKKHKIRTHAAGIKPAYRGISMNQLYDQLESEDHFKVAEE
jgi:metal-responsive CopG/Arc/MetJ family transcriptional regulator